MTLSKCERETIITYNEEDSTANVYTCSPMAKRQFEKTFGIEMTARGDSPDSGWEVNLPKSYLVFRKPRVLSAKAKESLVAASKKTRFA